MPISKREREEEDVFWKKYFEQKRNTTINQRQTQTNANKSTKSRCASCLEFEVFLIGSQDDCNYGIQQIFGFLCCKMF